MPIRSDHDELHQTRFAVEEPMFEGLGSYPVDEPVEQKPKTPLLKRKKVVIALSVGVTIFAVLILLIINALIAQSRRPQAPESVPLSVSETPTDAAFLVEKIEAVQAELEKADPSKSILIFPAIDASIAIDPEEE